MKRLSLTTSLLYQISKRLLCPWFVQWFVLFFIEVPKLQSKKLFYSLSGTNPFFVRCPGYRNHTSFPSTITFSTLNPISQAVHLPSFINLCFNSVHFHFQSIHFPQLCHFTCIRSEIYLHQTCFASNCNHHFHPFIVLFVSSVTIADYILFTQGRVSWWWSREISALTTKCTAPALPPSEVYISSCTYYPKGHCSICDVNCAQGVFVK